MQINRKEIATLLLLLLAFNCGIRLLKKSIFLDRSEVPLNKIDLQEKRLKGLKENLPPRGLVGFVNDTSQDPIEKLREHYVTQYLLTPLIVVDSKDQKLLIAYFKEDVQLNQWLQEETFVILKNFKNGVALLGHREERGK